MGLWTWTHFFQIIPTFAGFLVITVILARALGNKEESVRYIPLKVIAVTLVVLEIIKQINSAMSGAYDLYALPFHYCSLFLYLFPLHAFYRGKHSHIIHAATLGCLSSVTLAMIVIPNIIYTDTDILNFFNTFPEFHTVIFHNLVVLYFMLTIALRLYEINAKHDMKVMTVFLSAYVAVATVLAYTLKVNFHNLYRCNVQFIEDIHVAVVEAIGVIGTILYVLILFVLTILVSYLSLYLTRLLIKGIDKITHKNGEVK